MKTSANADLQCMVKHLNIMFCDPQVMFEGIQRSEGNNITVIVLLSHVRLSGKMPHVSDFIITVYFVLQLLLLFIYFGNGRFIIPFFFFFFQMFRNRKRTTEKLSGLQKLCMV